MSTHYLRAERPEQFVEAITELATDPDLRRSLGGHGVELVGQKYSTSALTTTIHSRLHELI